MAIVVPVFPTGIYVENLEPINQEEKNYLQNIEYIENVGNQTSANNFILDVPELSRIKQMIMAQLDNYVKNVICPINPLSLYMTQSWANKNGYGRYHHIHKHVNSIISGVYYISPKNPSPIVFHRKGVFGFEDIFPKNINEFNAPEFTFPVEQNSLILFPSSMVHSVNQNDQNEERLSIAFNTFFRGQIGDRVSLSFMEV